MINIFDFNPTREELDIFAGDGCSRKEIAALDKESQLMMIGDVLWSRGKIDEAKKYIEQIDDEQFKLDIYRTVTHP